MNSDIARRDFLKLAGGAAAYGLSPKLSQPAMAAAA